MGSMSELASARSVRVRRDAWIEVRDTEYASDEWTLCLRPGADDGEVRVSIADISRNVSIEALRTALATLEREAPE